MSKSTNNKDIHELEIELLKMKLRKEELALYKMSLLMNEYAYEFCDGDCDSCLIHYYFKECENLNSADSWKEYFESIALEDELDV